MHGADIANFSEKYPELNDKNKITKQLSREVVLDILHEKLKRNNSIKIKTIDDDLENLVKEKLSTEIPEKIKTELGGTINFLSLLPNSNDNEEAVKEFYSKPEKEDPISNFVDFVDVLLKAFGVDSLKPPSAKPGIRTKSGSKGEKSNSFVDELINLCCPADRHGK